jgi:isopentenyl-diphosphate delta-isomerase
MDEQIVLVNDAGEIIGAAPKLASHHADTPLHLAFSCYVFNDKGQFLLTKRAHGKKVWPDVWTNSACGHPGPDEPNEAAIRRRLLYELGISEVHDLAVVDQHYRYTTPPYNGIIENELCPIFICRTSQQPKPNPEEVDDFKWVEWGKAVAISTETSQNPSYWFTEQVQIINSSPLLTRYTHLESK